MSEIPSETPCAFYSGDLNQTYFFWFICKRIDLFEVCLSVGAKREKTGEVVVVVVVGRFRKLNTNKSLFTPATGTYCVKGL